MKTSEKITNHFKKRLQDLNKSELFIKVFLEDIENDLIEINKKELTKLYNAAQTELLKTIDLELESILTKNVNRMDDRLSFRGDWKTFKFNTEKNLK
jgi:hypothetical protein